MMAAKSLLLSFLLMGMGIAQHPITEGTQTPDTPTFTDPVGLATSTDPPMPPEEWECEISPESLPEYKELMSDAQKVPLQTRVECLLAPTIPDTPECEPLRKLEDFLQPRCPGMLAPYVLANIFEHINSDRSGSWTVQSAGHAVLDNTNPQDTNKCELSPQEAAKFDELASRVKKQMTWASAANCVCDSIMPDWLQPISPDGPKCEAVQELIDFDRPRCPRYYDNKPLGCAKLRRYIQQCTSCPETMDCQIVSQELKRDGVQLWDDNKVNDKSCPSSSLDEGESLLRQRDIIAVTSRLAHGDIPEQRDADEPYHPVLKPIYDDCDVLEDTEEHTRCVLVELQRALCGKEPWIRECQYLESALPDELLSKPNTIVNDLLDEILDTDGPVPVADDDVLRRPQVTAALEPTETARLFAPWLDLELFFEECEHADGYMAVEDCVYEKMRNDVCSNPGDELCQVPLPSFVNEHDLPLLHQDR